MAITDSALGGVRVHHVGWLRTTDGVSPERLVISHARRESYELGTYQALGQRRTKPVAESAGELLCLYYNLDCLWKGLSIL